MKREGRTDLELLRQRRTKYTHRVRGVLLPSGERTPRGAGSVKDVLERPAPRPRACGRRQAVRPSDALRCAAATECTVIIPPAAQPITVPRATGGYPEEGGGVEHDVGPAAREADPAELAPVHDCEDGDVHGGGCDEGRDVQEGPDGDAPETRAGEFGAEERVEEERDERIKGRRTDHM
uniref:Uncharacterized protein n=1 Tax=Mycena chlorophos TaxID=658473 RepID=A0ABQ0LMQ3_MYCCL|nr:predicted protein [Mycena chlorophos]